MPLGMGITFLIAMASRPSGTVNASILAPRATPLIYGLITLAFNGIAARSFITTAEMRTKTVALPLGIALPSIVTLSSTTVALSITRAAIVGTIGALFFVIVVLVSSWV